MIKEPKRLVEGAGELARSLAAAQRRLPSDERLAQLAGRLVASGAVLAQGAAAPHLPELPRRVVPPKGPLELSMKLVISGVVLGVLALGGALAIRHASPRTGAALGPAPTAPAKTLAQSPLPPPAVAPAPAPRSNGAPLPTRARTAAAGSEPRVVPSPATEAVPSSESADSEPPVSAAAEPARAERAPRAVRGPDSVPKRAAPKAPPLFEGGAAVAPAPSLPESTVVDSEVEMLKKARSALGSDSLEAFALSERCRAQYPNGAFAQEREFIAISALIRLGRRDEAQRRASLFRTHYRNSAYLPQLTRMLGEE